MKVALVSLVLNEAEFLRLNYEQHRSWNGVERIIYVEAADRQYAAASPHMTTPAGLSIDGTSDILRDLAAADPRVTVIHHGFMDHKNPAQAKTVGRNRYMEVLDDVKPDIFVALDCDEFYTHADQQAINDLAERRDSYRCWRLRQRHIWRPPSVAELFPQFGYEVTGGYWDVEHVRVFKWTEGLRYRGNHNWPEKLHYRPTRRMYHTPPAVRTDPQCVHLGFARAGRERTATNRYYEQRGEGKEPGSNNRKWYTECRASFETWKPGDRLPHGAVVKEYRGPVPEVYQKLWVPSPAGAA